METNDNFPFSIAVCCNVIKSASFRQIIQDASVALEITEERKGFRIIIFSISVLLNPYICRLRLV